MMLFLTPFLTCFLAWRISLKMNELYVEMGVNDLDINVKTLSNINVNTLSILHRKHLVKHKCKLYVKHELTNINECVKHKRKHFVNTSSK